MPRVTEMPPVTEPCAAEPCPSCGARTHPHHLCPYLLFGQDAPGAWAENNRAMCDFIHRGKPLPRVQQDQNSFLVDHFRSFIIEWPPVWNRP